MDVRKVRKVLGIGFLVCLVVMVGGLGFLRWDIQGDLDKWCATAQAAHPHPGDDVAALIDYVQSDANSLEDRNHAVWALGQARDERAVPVLKKFFTGKACDHDTDLCQNGLEKAIELADSDSINILAIRTPEAGDD